MTQHWAAAVTQTCSLKQLMLRGQSTNYYVNMPYKFDLNSPEQANSIKTKNKKRLYRIVPYLGKVCQLGAGEGRNIPRQPINMCHSTPKTSAVNDEPCNHQRNAPEPEQQFGVPAHQP